MKTLLLATAVIVVIAALAGCATTPDGRQTFDAAAAGRILSAVGGVLNPQPEPQYME